MDSWLQHVSSNAAVSPTKHSISLLLVICVEYSCGHFSRKEKHNKVHCYDYGRGDMRSQDETSLEFVSTNVIRRSNQVQYTVVASRLRGIQR